MWIWDRVLLCVYIRERERRQTSRQTGDIHIWQTEIDKETQAKHSKGDRETRREKKRFISLSLSLSLPSPIPLFTFSSHVSMFDVVLSIFLLISLSLSLSPPPPPLSLSLSLALSCLSLAYLIVCIHKYLRVYIPILCMVLVRALFFFPSPSFSGGPLPWPDRLPPIMWHQPCIPLPYPKPSRPSLSRPDIAQRVCVCVRCVCVFLVGGDGSP